MSLRLLIRVQGENEDDDLLDEDECLTIDELPSLLYQLTLLGNKADIQSEVSPELSTKVLNCLSFCTDTLLSLFFTSSESNRSGIENVCLTICHHISLTVSKDKSLCHQIMSNVKQRKIGSNSAALKKYAREHYPARDRNSILISPAILMLAFMVAKSPRQEEKITAILFDVVEEIHALNERGEYSLWYMEQMWMSESSGDSLTSESIMLAFEMLFSGPLMFEPIVR
jgi:hypothetical protein